MQIKTEIMDAPAVERAIRRIAHQLRERRANLPQPLCLLGIRSRGIDLAQLIAAQLLELGLPPPTVAELDVAAFRDDRPEAALAAPPPLDFSIAGWHVVIVDDVIQTGRTMRAALAAAFACGRPDQVELAVLVDRGHRQLPFKPDYIGKNVPTATSEQIIVRLAARDGSTGVYLAEP